MSFDDFEEDAQPYGIPIDQLHVRGAGGTKGERGGYEAMKCPHCDKEIPGVPCQQCDTTTPEGADYCMGCGVALVERSEDTIEDDNNENRYQFPIN